MLHKFSVSGYSFQPTKDNHPQQDLQLDKETRYELDKIRRLSSETDKVKNLHPFTPTSH